MVNAGTGKLIIGIVGPCGSGKSTLVQGVTKAGYVGRHIAQEHSYVPYMWERITNPDFLIYLDASFNTCTSRRKLNWSMDDYREQLRRLVHAREHADLIIATDSISPQEVLDRLIAFLNSREE